MKKKKVSSHIKDILWATDFSNESFVCLPYIRFFSEKLNTNNHGLYVLPRFSDWVYETAFIKDDELLKTIEKTKEASTKRIEAVGKIAKISIEAGSLEGIASEELINYAENNEIDLIFAGRKGESEIEDILVGSTTSRLIRNSGIPVFVIPKPKEDEYLTEDAELAESEEPDAEDNFVIPEEDVKVERILSPIDLGESTLLELRYSINLAKQLDAKLYVVHVAEFFNYKVPVFKRDALIDKISKKITAIAEDNEFEIENIVYETGEPAYKIIETAKQNNIDLVVMATHQRKGFEKFFLGSISEKVLMYSNIPVLVLPPSDYELS